MQRDANGLTVLENLTRLKMHHFLQISHVERIVSSLWTGEMDSGGSIFDTATTYELTCRNKLKFREDSELRNRFCNRRVGQDQPKPHRFSLKVWEHSMSLRLLLEVLAFFLLMAVFQHRVSRFSQGLRHSEGEHARLSEIEQELSL